MKLYDIKFVNIGPYHIEKIDLRTNRYKNIILLCGENGAGKTTFLKAVKLGLFGSYLFGLKQQSKSNTYIDEVRSIIRNNAKNGSIEITFSIVEDFEEKTYKIRRFWDFDPAFKETISIELDGRLLANEELLNTITYISNFYTPNVIDAIMFDGEKIISMIEDNQLSTYVKDCIHNLFGLNTYLSLIDDLEDYLNNFVSEESLTIEQINLKEKEKEIKILKNQLSKDKDKLKSLEKLLESNKHAIDEKLMVYSEMGGIEPSKIKSIKEKISNIEKERENSKLLLKAFFEKDILYLLNKKLIKAANKQISLEEPKRYVDNLIELHNSNVLNNDEKIAIETILNKLKGISPETTYINLGKNEINEFNMLSSEIIKSKKVYKELIKLNQENNSYLKELKSSITITENDQMEKLHNEITKNIVENSNISKELDELIEKIEIISNQIKIVAAEIEDLKSIVFEQCKNNNAFVLAKKYQETCKTFYSKEINRITKILSEQCLTLIKNTYRKQNYISDLKITNNFDVVIYNNDKIKPLQQLSAGEKQLLVGAIVSTIIKTSKRNVFVIFDTPAGRLDNKHMVNFYENIMMNAASQVIIMPTSKEINSMVVEAIKEKTSKCYTIQYQDKGYSKILENKLFEKEWSE